MKFLGAVLDSRARPPLRHLPLALFLLGILLYGAVLAGFMLQRFDLASVLRLSSDDAFYYSQIARNLADGQFSTFDGGISRTNGYHPLWMLLITPLYWILDPQAALFAIKALEILLIAAGVVMLALAARLARLPWILLLAVPTLLYRQDGMLLGLEAAAAAAMLGLLFLALGLFARDQARWTWLLAAVAFSLPWARLELVAVSMTATAVLCLMEWPRGGTGVGARATGIDRIVRARPIVPLLSACAGLVVYGIYNQLVFGGPVPVSGATKQWWSLQRWEHGDGYDVADNFLATLRSAPFDDELRMALEVCAYLALVWWLVGRAGHALDRQVLVFFVAAFSLAAGHLAKFGQTVLTVHPDAPLFSWYFVPAYLVSALLVPLRVYAALHVIRRFVEPVSRRAAAVASLGVVAATILFLLATTDFARPFAMIERVSQSSYRAFRISSYAGAQVMNRILPEGSIVGSWDAGVIGYFSRFPVVNLDGLVNSYEYFRAFERLGLEPRDQERNEPLRAEYAARTFGVTHFANVRATERQYDAALFEGVSLSDAPQEGGSEFKLWAAAPSALGASESGAWFWKRIESHFDYRWDNVGVLVDEGLVQAFVRHCDPDRLRDTAIALSWVSGTRRGRASAWFPWENPRSNHLGHCVLLLEPPNDAEQIEALRPEDYLSRVASVAAPSVRSNYDVYLHENALVYVTGHCSADDVEHRFFVHVTPVDAGDLTARGRRHGFENLDFDFRRAGVRIGERCAAVRALPAYDIERIATGQFVPGRRRVWEVAIEPRSLAAGGTSP